MVNLIRVSWDLIIVCWQGELVVFTGVALIICSVLGVVFITPLITHVFTNDFIWSIANIGYQAAVTDPTTTKQLKRINLRCYTHTCIQAWCIVKRSSHWVSHMDNKMCFSNSCWGNFLVAWTDWPKVCGSCVAILGWYVNTIAIVVFLFLLNFLNPPTRYMNIMCMYAM